MGIDQIPSQPDITSSLPGGLPHWLRSAPQTFALQSVSRPQAFLQGLDGRECHMETLPTRYEHG
jgi:hypothetical protein